MTAPPQGEGKGTETEAWAAAWHREAEELSWSGGAGRGGKVIAPTRWGFSSFK